MEGRALWSGVITFGLVSIPIKLYTATDSKSVSFNQIHAKCKTRIQERRWCPTCARSVEWEEIEKGFEYAKGKYIPITKEDLESVPLPSKNTIAVQSFVSISEIDPIYFEKSYYIEPDGKAMRPFCLLMQTMSDKNMVAIGAFTIRTKERLCCLRPVGGALIVDTLLYPDEIKVDLNTKLPSVTLTAQEKKIAASLVDMMAHHFSPEDFKDHYREALEKLIDAKLEGLPPQQEEGKETRQRKGTTPDLMESLRHSLNVIEGGKSSSKRTSLASTAKTESTKPKKTAKARVKIVKSPKQPSKTRMTVGRKKTKLRSKAS
jgi:DNA end-binding protein Ku